MNVKIFSVTYFHNGGVSKTSSLQQQHQHQQSLMKIHSIKLFGTKSRMPANSYISAACASGAEINQHQLTF